MGTDPTAGLTLNVVVATRSITARKPTKSVGDQAIESSAQKGRTQQKTGMLEKTSKPRPPGMVKASNPKGVGNLADFTA